MWKKNNRQVVAGVIAVLLVLAMIVPMLLEVMM